MNEIAESMKVERLLELLTIFEKMAPPASHPPTEMNTLRPLVVDFRFVNRG